MGSSPVIGTGVHAVEFSLREDVTHTLKRGYKESNRLSSLRREKLAFGRDGCRTTYTRDVSGLDHPIHVKCDETIPRSSHKLRV